MALAGPMVAEIVWLAGLGGVRRAAAVMGAAGVEAAGTAAAARQHQADNFAGRLCPEQLRSAKQGTTNKPTVSFKHQTSALPPSDASWQPRAKAATTHRRSLPKRDFNTAQLSLSWQRPGGALRLHGARSTESLPIPAHQHCVHCGAGYVV